MKDTTYRRFVKRWEEVTDLPPQTVGPFTPYYKRAVRHLKIMPWPALVAAAIVAVGALYLVIGSAITIVTSILQRGF
jgi:hypothetical protein